MTTYDRRILTSVTVPVENIETLTTLTGVEIADVGDEWPAFTGPFTVTEEDFQSIIASQDDPAVKPPRVKIGHFDPRFTPDGDSGLFDGTPVFGKFTNLRTTEDGLTLLGDIVGIPKWLAKIAPVAWPSRSGEWTPGYTSPVTGKEWPMVLTAVALLGITLPAIASIEDLQVLFTETGPDGVRVVVEGVKVRASAAEQRGAMRRALTSVGFESIRRSFFEDFATEASGRYYWWPHQIFIQPTAVIAEDDEGSIFFVKYSLSGDTITWAEPEEARHQYVDESGKVLAGQRVAVFASAAEARPRDRIKTTRKADHVPDDDKTRTDETETETATDGLKLDPAAIRLALRLPEDATDAQVSEAVEAAATEPVVRSEEKKDKDDETEVEIPEGQMLVSTKVWEETQDRLGRAEDFISTSMREKSDRRVADRVEALTRAGRIARSEREFVTSLLETDFDRVSRQYDALPANTRVNTKLRGTVEEPKTSTTGGTGLFDHLYTNN